MNHLVALPLSRAREIGSNTYVTLYPCPSGHFIHRSVSRRSCSICVRDKNKKRNYERYQNQDVRAEICKRKRERYASDEEYKEKIKKGNSEWYRENSEDRIEKQKERYWNNVDQERAWHRDHYQKIKDKRAAYHYQYKLENPERVKAWQSANRKGRRARTLDTDSELTQFVLEEAFDLAERRAAETGFEWQVDHAIPLMGRSVSGFHFWNNIQVIPAFINTSKHNKLIYTEPLEFLSACT